MNKYILLAVVLLAAVVVAVVVLERRSTSTQVPDLDAAAVETGKNLHPPKLNP